MTSPTAGTAIVSSAQQIVASVVRTLVPFLVGVLIKGFAQIGVVLDGETATLLVNGLISAGIAIAYYGVARALEVFGSSKFGWLLGYAKAAPLYLKPAQKADDAAAASDTEAVANGELSWGLVDPRASEKRGPDNGSTGATIS